jgi:hypothetical protein
MKSKAKHFTNFNITVLLVFDLLLLFSITFIGDYNISGFPLFFLIWLVLLMRRKFSIGKIELIAQILTLALFLPTFIRPSLYLPIYYVSSIFPALYINAIYFGKQLFYRLRKNLQPTQYMKTIILVLFLTLAYATVGLDSVRQSILFGPNVYYRAIGFFAVFYTYLFKETLKKTSGKRFSFSYSYDLLALFIVLGTSFFCLLRTNSRGSVFVILFLFLLTINMVIQKNKESLYKSVYVFLTFIFTLTFIFFEPFLSVFHKLISNSMSQISKSRISDFSFATQESSFGIRQYFFHNLPEYFSNHNFMFGEGNYYIVSINSKDLFYPHNLYLDLLYNQGLYTLVIFMTASLFCAVSLLNGEVSTSLSSVATTLIPIYLGSQFSGTLYDNYSVLAVIILIPLSVNLNRRNLKKMKGFI